MKERAVDGAHGNKSGKEGLMGADQKTGKGVGGSKPNQRGAILFYLVSCITRTSIMADPEVQGYGGYTGKAVEFEPESEHFTLKALGDIVTENLDEHLATSTIWDIARDNTEACAEEWMEDSDALNLPLIPAGRLSVRIVLHVKRPKAHFVLLGEEETTVRLREDAPEVSDDLTVNIGQVVRVVTHALVGVVYANANQVIDVQVTTRWGKCKGNAWHHDWRGENGAFKVDVFPCGWSVGHDESWF